MGNETSTTSQWREEKVVEAQHVERPNTSGGVSPNFYHHHGVKVKLESGREMLLHNDKQAGVVATDASNMSSNWSVTRDVSVNHDLKAQHLMNAMSAIRNTQYAVPTDWFTSGTCIGSSTAAESALENGTVLGFPKILGEGNPSNGGTSN